MPVLFRILFITLPFFFKVFGEIGLNSVDPDQTDLPGTIARSVAMSLGNQKAP